MNSIRAHFHISPLAQRARSILLLLRANVPHYLQDSKPLQRSWVAQQHWWLRQERLNRNNLDPSLPHRILRYGSWFHARGDGSPYRYLGFCGNLDNTYLPPHAASCCRRISNDQTSSLIAVWILRLLLLDMAPLLDNLGTELRVEADAERVM